MRRLINIMLTAAMLVACEQLPMELGITETESFEKFVTGLEQDARNGVIIDWSKAEERYAAYTATLPSASAEMIEAERLKQDDLVGRWWAARVQNMTFREACEYLKSKGRQAEAFLEEIQR